MTRRATSACARQGFRWYELDLTWYGLRQQTEKQEIDGVMRPRFERCGDCTGQGDE